LVALECIEEEVVAWEVQLDRMQGQVFELVVALEEQESLALALVEE